MVNTTVMHFISYFGKVKLIVNNQFFDFFNFVGQIEFFYDSTLNLRKKD